MAEAIQLQPVNLKDLHIEREMWGPNNGQYKGRVSFDGPNGKLEFTLPPDLSLKFLQLSSEILASVSQEAAKRVHGDVLASIEHARALPNAIQPLHIR